MVNKIIQQTVGSKDRLRQSFSLSHDFKKKYCICVLDVRCCEGFSKRNIVGKKYIVCTCMIFSLLVEQLKEKVVTIRV